MNKYLHVTLNFRASVPSAQLLDSTFNIADDWVKYAPNCWILWTSRPSSDWFYFLKPLLGPDDQMLIVGLDMAERNGWLPQWIWEWIDKKRQLGPPPPPAQPPADLSALAVGTSGVGGFGLLGAVPYSALLPFLPPDEKK